MGTQAPASKAGTPSREDVDPAALDVVRRRGAEIMSTARRYAATPEDAEDAYQRGLEILLTKAPTTDEEELVPWLKTVVKHEAFAIRRQRERSMPVEDGALEIMAGLDPGVEERAEQLDRLRVGAEALDRLKPHERRALLLRAEGHSYKQIQEITGWTYTKVNRCLVEGRRAFLERVSGIESGAECERLAPLLSRLADDEATPDDTARLQPHLLRCQACQATLRDYRRAPAAAAALAAPGAMLAAGAMGSKSGGGLPGLDAPWGWVQERFYLLSTKLQALFEAATAHKAAAIAASTVAVAGGGAATAGSLHSGDADRDPARAEQAPKTRMAAPPAASADAPDVLPAADDERRRRPRGRPEAPATAVDPPERDAGTTAPPRTEPAHTAPPTRRPAPTGAAPEEQPPAVEGGEFGP